jgi:polar amino acid transport system substrate-binding protein
MLIRVLIFLIVTNSLAGHVFASEIRFMTHNTKEKTFIDENGELRGKKHAGRRAFNVELVRAMMIIQNHPIKMEVIPFKRGLKYVQTMPDCALFNVVRTQGREKTVKWVGPLLSDVAYFYELKSEPTGIKTLEDAKRVDSICVLNGNVHDTFLMGEGFNNLYRNKNYVGCFKMLAAGRVSLTASNILALPERLESAGILVKDIQQTPVKLFETHGYIAFSMNIPDKIIKKWQISLDQLKESGKYRTLVEMYLTGREV